MASLKQTAGHKMAAFTVICLHDFEVLVFNKQDKKSNVNLLCVYFLVCSLLILILLIGPVILLWCGLIPFKCADTVCCHHTIWQGVPHCIITTALE